MHESPSSSPHPFLTGQRIVLAPLRREDAPLYEGWLNAAKMRGLLTLYAPITHEQELATLDRMLAEPAERAIHLGIWERDEMPRLVGNVSLFAINHRSQHATLGIFIGPEDAQGRGLGREAIRFIAGYGFGTLNLRKIILTVMGQNARAKHLYETLGFVEVGRWREHVFIEGRFEDEILTELWRENAGGR